MGPAVGGGTRVEVNYTWDLVDGDRETAEAEFVAQVGVALDQQGIVHETRTDAFMQHRSSDGLGVSQFAVRTAGADVRSPAIVTIPALDRAEFERKIAFLRDLGTDDRLGHGPGLDGLTVHIQGPAADSLDTQQPPFTRE